MRFSLRLLVLLVLVAQALGCRTYGGHGTEDATLRQIEAAQAQFARDLVQARNDFRSLSESAAGSTVLQPAVEAYQATLLAHEALMRQHESVVEEAQSNAGAYRYLSRTLRGMHSEQEMVYRRYQQIQRVVNAGADAAERPGSIIPRYHVVPSFYERTENVAYTRGVGGMWRALPPGAATAVTADDAGEAGPGGDTVSSDSDTPEPGPGGNGADAGAPDAAANGAGDDTAPGPDQPDGQ